jgi:nitroreductase
MELIDAIKGRRSIRKYKPGNISDAHLNLILEAARWAPSWANTQCWEFIIVKDRQMKELLAETMPQGNPARPAFSQAPIIIVACAQKGKAGYFKGQPGTSKGDWLMFDTALALQNLTLAAYALGLGTVHVGYFDAQKAAQMLKVPSQVEVVELVPLGVPDEEAKPPKRKQIQEFLFYNYYGQQTP